MKFLFLIALLPFTAKGWIKEMENKDLYQGKRQFDRCQTGCSLTFGSRTQVSELRLIEINAYLWLHKKWF